jgi:hypothetical protein
VINSNLVVSHQESMIADFCNKICQKQTHAPQHLCMGAR